MAYAFPTDIQKAVAKHLAGGTYASADDLLRDALRALSDEEKDLDAVRGAVAEWKAGDPGMPLDRAVEEIRRTQAGNPQA